jgi:hypothetical protein
VSAATPHKLRPWVLAVALVGLIGGPVVLYHLLPAAGASAAVASGVVLVVAVKHLGVLAALVTPYALFRRRSRRRRDER